MVAPPTLSSMLYTSSSLLSTMPAFSIVWCSSTAENPAPPCLPVCVRRRRTSASQPAAMGTPGSCVAIPAASGAMLDQANRTKGENQAILAKSEATARGIRMVSQAMTSKGSTESANLRIVEQYVKAFSQLAITNNSMLLAGIANPAHFIAQAVKIYQSIQSNTETGAGHPPN